MEQNQSTQILAQLKNRWFYARFFEFIFTAMGICCWLFPIVYFLSTGNWLISLGVALFALLGIFLFRLYQSRLLKLNELLVARLLNQQIPDLESSTELLLKEEKELGTLARLQKNKISQRLPLYLKEVSLPHQLQKSAIFLLFSFLCSTILINIIFFTENKQSLSEKEKKEEFFQPNKKSELPLGVQSGSLRLEPPSYTGLSGYESKNMNLSAVEGSVVFWEFEFTKNIKRGCLVFSNKDSVWLEHQSENIYIVSGTLLNTGFYTLQYEDEAGQVQHSDYYAIEVTPDQKPQIKVSNLNQYTDLQFDPHLSVTVESQISDDYGLTDAFIVATVTKGKGESVKFREEKLFFEPGITIGSKSANLQKQFRLSELNMGPGDELYFYIEARDNKTPQAQKNRSEVYFIALADTSSQSLNMDLGMGVNQMPDYFRSQRQLIIDTEKLLVEASSISEEEFQIRSNNIGVDQKILRLRYGQFLGEEFESEIGGHSHEGEEHTHFEGDGHGEEDEAHKSWKEKTSSLKVLEKNEHGHTEDQKFNNSLYKDVPESVMHIHDSQEEMSFLDESLKAQLRVVLNNMWESELRLRTNRPKESLPFQYKALYLLKDIQQKSRVYVERVGFAPPPLEEKGKRLTGELDKIKNPSEKRKYEAERLYPNLISLVGWLEKLKEGPSVLNPDKALFQLAGAELAQIAIERPGQYLQALKIIRQVVEGQINAEMLKEESPKLFKILWTALPMDRPDPALRKGIQSTLNQLFLQELGKQ